MISPSKRLTSLSLSHVSHSRFFLFVNSSMGSCFLRARRSFEALYPAFLRRSRRTYSLGQMIFVVLRNHHHLDVRVRFVPVPYDRDDVLGAHGLDNLIDHHLKVLLGARDLLVGHRREVGRKVPELGISEVLVFVLGYRRVPRVPGIEFEDELGDDVGVLPMRGFLEVSSLSVWTLGTSSRRRSRNRIASLVSFIGGEFSPTVVDQ